MTVNLPVVLDFNFHDSSTSIQCDNFLSAGMNLVCSLGHSDSGLCVRYGHNENGQPRNVTYTE